MDHLRVAVIGAGFMGKAHSLAWRSVAAVFGLTPRPALEVLCDVDAERTAAKAAEWGFARTTTDWRRVVEDPAIDAVSVTTPNHMHREIAVAALAAGKHVWCEKPMATALADAEAMARAAAGTPGLVAVLGYNFACNPALLHARRLIAEGAIGRIVDVRGQIDEDYLADPEQPWSWRLQKSEAGFGTIGDLTVHLLSMIHLLAGPVAELCASVETVHPTRPLADGSGRRAVDTDDIGHALLRFSSGAAGVIGSSRIAHGRKNVIRLEIHGDRGMIAFDQERFNELELYLAEGPRPTRGFRRILTGADHPPYGQFCPAPGHQLGFNDLKTIEAARFIDAIAGREEPVFGFAAGLTIERTIHAMARSAARRAWVRVEGEAG
ncbi:Gfo/Idh/MocA family protein [Labrys wisconsinensis]|uniref:Dehydrogenase n=1 Tax=Labrys wisconsinensis TaxID=425677 RepID=A0ABU0JIC0_9HYPH|nr:Gfo/Idh/MocA family oxidoreductase [Labrys wisconsinensis]MDQ0474027.1 putative dehydrogenase [Labrys wisconsinensis]